MIARKWQAECIAQAHRQFRAGLSHFLCLATPGAGKTKMAALLTKQLFDDGLIDLVVCFAPSVIVADDFRIELEIHTGQRMDGRLGSRGCALTYQAMLNLPDDFWTLFSQHRVFVIFDEIHHCAGQTVEMANAWGERIICDIQGRASYTLALTGTPWRSDRIPIVLSRYCEDRQRIHCDYQYGLNQSIQDRVCRIPNLIVIDNDNITLSEGASTERFNSIKDLLEESRYPYQQLLANEALITYIVRQADKKLSALRKTIPDAGGLIVAATVEHAHQIARLLKKVLNEDALVATYYEDNANLVIRHFKAGTQKWIISVGMISEGTNIPRLRVCCHLTRVKTELYFRQVLGRILRSSGEEGETAYLYMPAEPALVQYAERLADDIPAMDVIRFERMPRPSRLNEGAQSNGGETPIDNALQLTMNTPVQPSIYQISPEREAVSPSALAQSYESTLSLFGKFRQEILSLHLSSAIRI
jgi:superfamily II DNA or RNA helicase